MLTRCCGPIRVRPIRFSNKYLRRFKKEQGFSTVRMRVKQHATRAQTVRSHEREDECAAFDAEVRRAIEQLGPSRVFNMDELPARTAARSVSALHDCRRVRDESMDARGDPRGSVTAMVTVSASGEKLPLAFIAKGKTVRAEAKMRARVLPPNFALHSPSGWVDESVMEQYIERVIAPVTDGEPCALVMDDFKTHWTDTALVRNSIQPINVPAGLTSKKQPLDVGVNSVIQNGRDRRWTQQIQHDVLISVLDLHYGKAEAVTYTQCSFESDVDEQTIQAAWKRACNLDDNVSLND